MRTSLTLPADLWKAARIRAVEEGRPAGELVVDALRSYLLRVTSDNVRPYLRPITAADWEDEPIGKGRG